MSPAYPVRIPMDPPHSCRTVWAVSYTHLDVYKRQGLVHQIGHAPLVGAKAPAQKVEEVYLQFGADEWRMADLMDQAKAAYVAEGHRASGIKKLALYVKPEERKAYYVINEKATGSIEF